MEAIPNGDAGFRSMYLPAEAGRWPDTTNEPQGQMISQRQFTGGHITQGSGHHFKRSADPSHYSVPELMANGNIQVIEKVVERLVEVVKPVPVAKVVECLHERLQIIDKQSIRDVPQVQTRVIIENVDKQVFIDREVYKEMVQEVVIDKEVQRIKETIKQVPVEKIVEKRVEVIEEVPVIRYVDKVITKEVPVIQVVDRVVEILREKPVETIKEVPVYVKMDVGGEEPRIRGSIAAEASVTATFIDDARMTGTSISDSQAYVSMRVAPQAQVTMKSRPVTMEHAIARPVTNQLQRDLC